MEDSAESKHGRGRAEFPASWARPSRWGQEVRHLPSRGSGAWRWREFSCALCWVTAPGAVKDPSEVDKPHECVG